MKLYKSNRTLTNHLKTTHKTSTRTLTNIDLITSNFSIDPIYLQSATKNWTDTLQYLHKLDLIPFSFRRSLYNKTPIKIRHQLKNMLYKIIEIVVTSTCPHTEANSPHLHQYLTSPTAFWKLFLLFEGTMLAPASPQEPKKHKTLVKYRIDMFFNGKFHLLHKSAARILSPPNTTTPDLDNRKDQIVKAANNDDWRKASNLLQAPLPPVSYSDQFFPAIKKLHPPPTTYTSPDTIACPNPTLHQQTFLSSSDKVRARLLDETLLLSTLRRLKREKSAGPYADSTDMLKDVFLVRSKALSDDEERYPHIALLGNLLNLL